MGQYERAGDLYKRALKLFQEASNEAAVMLTCNSLGRVEQRLGRLPEARAWYERSREIAQRRADIEALGGTAQNIGIVCQLEGEAARQHGDEATARHHFQEAERSLRESLHLRVRQDDKPGEAMARGQLARVSLLTGEMDKAEEHAHKAREISETLGLLRELPVYYDTLADVARARGEEAQAVEWEAKRDAVREELVRPARGGRQLTLGQPLLAVQAVREELERPARGGQGGSGLPGQVVQAILRLVVECAQAGVSGEGVSEEAGEALGQLAGMGPPLGAVATFLRGLVAGEFPAGVPDGLPGELKGPLQQILDAAREARGGA
jgi:tetratricopeptide (TPR) repeat protein